MLSSLHNHLNLSRIFDFIVVVRCKNYGTHADHHKHNERNLVEYTFSEKDSPYQNGQQDAAPFGGYRVAN